MMVYSIIIRIEKKMKRRMKERKRVLNNIMKLSKIKEK
jgi:hypothetical protein